ncbi:MAG: hypothetical protein WD534_13085 [Phycisphaeraceae bacterium]
MGRVTSLVLASVVVVLIALHVSVRADEEPAPAARGEAVRWEYMIVSFDELVEDDFVFRGREQEYDQMQSRMNRLGLERWELVTMDDTMLIFKRTLETR